jgi:hypothetical protein
VLLRWSAGLRQRERNPEKENAPKLKASVGLDGGPAMRSELSKKGGREGTERERERERREGE